MIATQAFLQQAPSQVEAHFVSHLVQLAGQQAEADLRQHWPLQSAAQTLSHFVQLRLQHRESPLQHDPSQPALHAFTQSALHCFGQQSLPEQPTPATQKQQHTATAIKLRYIDFIGFLSDSVPLTLLSVGTRRFGAANDSIVGIIFIQPANVVHIARRGIVGSRRFHRAGRR
ncbi:MAG TPA: hypothetical protein VNT79_03885, partial [Phycisphaerae bacterium]|nr:hypothetical protein [Phycisphaerae bacterium]